MFASPETPNISSANVSGPVPQSPNRLPSELIIGALVPPVLLGILLSRALADTMTQVGLVSEQLYRGERLPTLNMPAADSDPETVGK